MASIWQELKRRNVVRVGVAYAVVAWLALQIADVVLNNVESPPWVFQVIMLVIGIGFPLTLIFAWAFELTAEGIKKERDVDRTESITQTTGRKLDYIVISVLAIALVFFALDKFVWTESDTPSIASDSAQRTIAVLPFVNMSDDPAQEFFSDGLAEELLNLLAKIPELRVTSRTSAFSFKDKDVTIAEIGRTLDVNHVLEGSVRRSSDTIRITAQLINVSSDTHEWSDTWDRDFSDVFAIQDEIAQSVVAALKVRLLGELPTTIETTPEAYALFLQAEFLISQRNTPSVLQAEALLKRVLKIDPEYAPAWGSLAWTYAFGSSLGVREPHEGVPLAKDAAERALRLDPNNTAAHLMLAANAMRYDYDLATVERELNIALRLGSNDSEVLATAAWFAQQQGRFEDAIQYVEKANELDPLGGRKAARAYSYFYAGRKDEALALFRKSIEQAPFGERLHANLARALLLTGDPEGALAVLEKEVADGHQAAGRALVYKTIGDEDRSAEELRKLLALGNRWTFEIAEVHAHRGEVDEAFLWLDRAIARRDSSLQAILYTPFLDNLRDDPRFAEVLERLGRKPRP
jgi:adenylate cyclase